MNSITHVVSLTEKGLCQLISNAKPEWVSNVSSLFESYVVRKQVNDPETAQHCRTIQPIFNLANFAWVSLETYHISALISEIKFLYNIFGDFTQPIAFVGTLVGLVAGATFMSIRFQKLAPMPDEFKKEIDEAERQHVNLKWNSPFNQSSAVFFQAMRIVANVGLILLSPTAKLSAAFNLLCLGYSYSRLSQMKWIELKQEFATQFATINGQLQQKITFFYHFLVFNPKPTEKPKEVNNAEEADTCAICTDEIDDKESKTNTFFCTKHIYHIPCIVSYFYTKSKEFVNGGRLSAVDEFKNGQFENRSYTIQIPQANIPNCPTCRDFPKHAKVTASIWDSYRKNKCTASVVLLNEKIKESWFDTKLYQRATVVYDAFKATLATIQSRHFDLTGPILAIKRWCLITDLALLASEAYALFNKTKGRSLTIDMNQAHQDIASKKHFWKSLSAAVTIACAATLATICLNQLFMPTINAKDLLVNAMKMTPKQAANISLTWDKSFTEQFAQWILACRILINAGTIAITKKPYEKVASLVLQTFSLYKNSQFYSLFVDLTHTNLPSGVLSMSSRFQFVTNPAASLQEQLSYIYNYMTSVFNGSSWSGSRDQYGNVTWNVNVLSKLPQASDINLPFLDSASGYAIDSFYRAGGGMHIQFAS